MKVKVDGQMCTVISRGEYYTKVSTPFHDIIEVRNDDIENE